MGALPRGDSQMGVQAPVMSALVASRSRPFECGGASAALPLVRFVMRGCRLGIQIYSGSLILYFFLCERARAHLPNQTIYIYIHIYTLQKLKQKTGGEEKNLGALTADPKHFRS